jgi:hypothetical protein
MSKGSGLGVKLYIHGYDYSTDFADIKTLRVGRAVLPATGIDKSAFERLQALKDGEIATTLWFDPGSNMSHSRVKLLPKSDVICTFGYKSVLGNVSAGLVSKQINYDGNRANDGGFTFDMQALANGSGLEWGNQLTAGVRTDTSATNGTAYDFTAATSFGWSAYLHVFSFSGTDVTVKLQDSADNVSFTDLSGAAFTQITAAHVAERLEAASATATVRRYVRASTVTTGGFTSLGFMAMIMKNEA